MDSFSTCSTLTVGLLSPLCLSLACSVAVGACLSRIVARVLGSWSTLRPRIISRLSYRIWAVRKSYATRRPSRWTLKLIPLLSLLLRVMLCWEEVKLPVGLTPRDPLRKLSDADLVDTGVKENSFSHNFGCWGFMAIFFRVCCGGYDIEHGMPVVKPHIMISWLYDTLCGFERWGITPNVCLDMAGLSWKRAKVGGLAK